MNNQPALVSNAHQLFSTNSTLLAEFGSRPGGQMNLNFLRPHVGIHANALLRKYEWEEIDRTVYDVARTQLVGIQDLIELDLVHSLGDIGTILSTYEKGGDMSAADISMDGATAGERDRTTFTPVSVPVPIVHKDFDINIRQLTASRRNGEGLDVVQATIAARRVSDASEALLFNGTNAPTVSASTIYGYTNHPDRNTGSGSDWGTVTNVHTDIQSMQTALQADGYYGPYGLYVARTQYGQMFNRYTDGSGETALSSALNLFLDLQFVKPGDLLTDGDAVMVQLSRDVVDLAIAQDILTVQWQSMGGMVENFKVMAAWAPRLKSDSNSAMGVVHYSGL